MHFGILNIPTSMKVLNAVHLCNSMFKWKDAAERKQYNDGPQMTIYQ